MLSSYVQEVCRRVLWWRDKTQIDACNLCVHCHMRDHGDNVRVWVHVFVSLCEVQQVAITTRVSGGWWV